MNLIFSFIFSVLASIVAYYICKWLDRKQQLVASLGLNPPFQNGQKAPEVQLRGFCCINHEYISSFIAYRHYSICSSGMQYSKKENIYMRCHPYAGTERGVDLRKCQYRLLSLSWQVQLPSTFANGWMERSNRQPAQGLSHLAKTEQKIPRGVNSWDFCCPYGLLISFAYRHYSICSSGMQYSQIEKIMIYFISCITKSIKISARKSWRK